MSIRPASLRLALLFLVHQLLAPCFPAALVTCRKARSPLWTPPFKTLPMKLLSQILSSPNKIQQRFRDNLAVISRPQMDFPCSCFTKRGNLFALALVKYFGLSPRFGLFDFALVGPACIIRYKVAREWASRFARIIATPLGMGEGPQPASHAPRLNIFSWSERCICFRSLRL